MAAKLSKRRVGLTLLELILALSLSVVLLFAVGMALRLYWRSFDVKRTNIEQAHLARAILQKMGDDLRSAVQYTPVDLSGLETMTSSSNLAGAFAGMTGAGSPATAGASATAGGAGSGSGAGTGGGGATGTGGGTGASQTSQTGQGGASAGASGNSSASKTGGSSSTPSGSGATPSSGSAAGGSGTPASGQSGTGDTTVTDTTEETPPAVVGLYGTANQLQFDVSRLPRVDEYANNSPTSMVKIASDIKTVSYYVRSESSGGSGIISTFGSTPPPGSSEPSTSGQGRGLMRLELDRAVSAYGETSGSVASSFDSAKLLADEVTSIAFRYWTGTEWASEWNSDEMGGLPLAVEIVMTMANPNAPATTKSTTPSYGATATAENEEASYRIVVNLPTASLPPPAEDPESTDPMGAGATTSAGATGTPVVPGFGGAGSSGASGSSSGGTSGSGSSPSYGTGSTLSGGSK